MNLYKYLEENKTGNIIINYENSSELLDIEVLNNIENKKLKILIDGLFRKIIHIDNNEFELSQLLKHRYDYIFQQQLKSNDISEILEEYKNYISDTVVNVSLLLIENKFDLKRWLDVFIDSSKNNYIDKETRSIEVYETFEHFDNDTLKSIISFIDDLLHNKGYTPTEDELRHRIIDEEFSIYEYEHSLVNDISEEFIKFIRDNYPEDEFESIDSFTIEVPDIIYSFSSGDIIPEINEEYDIIDFLYEHLNGVDFKYINDIFDTEVKYHFVMSIEYLLTKLNLNKYDLMRYLTSDEVISDPNINNWINIIKVEIWNQFRSKEEDNEDIVLAWTLSSDISICGEMTLGEYIKLRSVPLSYYDKESPYKYYVVVPKGSKIASNADSHSNGFQSILEEDFVLEQDEFEEQIEIVYDDNKDGMGILDYYYWEEIVSDIKINYIGEK